MSCKMISRYECHFYKGDGKNAEYKSFNLEFEVNSLQEAYVLALQFIEDQQKEGWQILLGRFHASTLIEEQETVSNP